MNKKKTGYAGESMAARFLSGLGYSVLERNYLCESGEIDIIARFEDEIIFVEVKSWRRMGFENLEYAINKRKQTRIIESSKSYLVQNPDYANLMARYDVILLSERENQIYHINNAFSEVD